MRCLSASINRARFVSSREASKAGVRSMSTNSPRLSSKLLFRQFMLAVVKVSLALTPTSVARKSSASSKSAAGIFAVPPSRTIRAVMPASPGISVGSSAAPPLNVIETVIRGNSCEGARNTAVPSGSTRRNAAASGGVNSSGAKAISSGRAGIGLSAGAAKAPPCLPTPAKAHTPHTTHTTFTNSFMVGLDS